MRRAAGADWGAIGVDKTIIIPFGFGLCVPLQIRRGSRDDWNELRI